MKKRITLLLTTISFFLSLTSLNAQNMKMIITIGDKKFTATLNDSEAAQEFTKLLPMEISMGEHNGNEKFCNLSENMPGRSSNPGRVESGDLMIWSSSTLVLFYAGSSTSYSYIRLGKIDNPSGLSQELGRGSVKVNFELMKDKEDSENTKTENE